jgi:glycosyltransferase involved in cell wall biosynthesis
MLKVNAYTPGLNTPSGRYRVRQLIPYLEKFDIKVNEIYSRAEAFPPPKKSEHLFWAIRNMQENFFKMLSQPACDMTWLQRAMLSKYYTFEWALKKPMVFDVDDAIFVDNGGGFAQKIARQAQMVVCGNSFLADYFFKYNKNVEIIPTAVDVSKYDAIEVDKTARDTFYILWTGTSSGYPFVYKIEKALKRIVTKYDFVKIKIIANDPPQFNLLTDKEYIFEKWSPDIEFSSIKSCDIGIMPINDDDRSRGKCSYKMLCYMAAKIPIVVSPFGMNKEVLNLGNVGYGATSDDEWFDALSELISSVKIQKDLSINAYETVLKYFDINIIAKRLSDSLKKV